MAASLSEGTSQVPQHTASAAQASRDTLQSQQQPPTCLQLCGQLALQHKVVLMQRAAQARRLRQQPVEAAGLRVQPCQGLVESLALPLLRLQPAGEGWGWAGKIQ